MKYLLLTLFSLVGFAAEQKGKILSKEFKLDFSTATSVAGLWTLGSLQEGAIVKNAVAKVVTALAGTTTVSGTIGTVGNTDGYMLVKEVDAAALSTFQGNGDAIWDDSNDINIPYLVIDGQESVGFYITAGVLPSTGVLSIMLDYYVPQY